MAIGTTAAILGAAAVGAAGSVASGVLGAGAAKKAAAAQTASADKAAQIQKDSAIQSRIDAYPWAFQGAQALYQYMDELGISRPKNMILPDLNRGPFAQNQASNYNGGSLASNGAIASPGQIALTGRKGFTETPGYQYNVEQAEKGVVNNMAALGMRNSGAALQALTKTRMGLANQEYGNYLNRLAGAAGMGQTQTNQTNALTQNAAGNIGQAYQDAGAARASGYVGAANAWGNALSGVANNIGGALGSLPQNPYTPRPTGGLY